MAAKKNKPPKKGKPPQKKPKPKQQQQAMIMRRNAAPTRARKPPTTAKAERTAMTARVDDMGGSHVAAGIGAGTLANSAPSNSRRVL